ncbi:hypothetical protein M422DRAFT_251178 [Sphaerobolus stellatus SS14]|uniref:Uncharacterized protein n=1 Tax=Sphaerobolus stellatus (strain SS14) TaxID=990650 RepID=A0A0C9URB5_SPHS4|nr:hypothetical protein M422DRAFT_251178 [Sphaerobolus stellatus SS14]
MGTVRRYSYRTLHLPEDITPCSKTSTINFASINAHKGRPLSRCNNLESFTYTMMALSLRGLPWDCLATAEPLLKFTTSDNQDFYGKSQESATNLRGQIADILSHKEQLFKGQPPGMDRTVYASWMYAKSLDYYQEPDYELLTAMFLSFE